MSNVYPENPSPQYSQVVKTQAVYYQQQQQVPSDNQNQTVQGHPIQYPNLDDQQFQQCQQFKQEIYYSKSPEPVKDIKDGEALPLQPYNQLTESRNHIEVYNKNRTSQYFVSKEKPLYLPLEPQSRNAQIINCPYCKTVIKSEVKPEIGTGTHLLAAALLFTTGILAPLPYFIDRTKDSVHYCPRCNAKIGNVQF